MPVEQVQYPVNLILGGQPCLVVGGGSVAARKIAGLLLSGAHVQVIAKEVGQEVRDTGVQIEQRPYRPGDVAGYRLVVAAPDDAEVHHQVFEDAVAAGSRANTREDPECRTCTL